MYNEILDDEVEVVGRCAECGCLIHGDNEDVYIANGEYYCSLDCVCAHFGIEKYNDFLG